jgi:hypothetical protein
VSLGNLGDGVMGMQVNLFIFDCPSQPFYEDVTPPSASSTASMQKSRLSNPSLVSVPSKKLFSG